MGSPRSGVTAGEIVDRLLTQLGDLLDEELRLTEEMLGLSQTIQRHILADEFDSLISTAQEQEELARRMGQSEYTRLALIRHLSPYYPDLSRLRLSQCVERVPEPHASRLRPLSWALAKAAVQLQRLNRQNKSLIQRSLRYAELALGTEASTYGGARASYGSEGDSPRLYDRTL